MESGWHKYDVNDEGFIDAQRAAVFLRHVCIGDVELGIGLQ